MSVRSLNEMSIFGLVSRALRVVARARNSLPAMQGSAADFVNRLSALICAPNGCASGVQRIELDYYFAQLSERYALRHEPFRSSAGRAKEY